MGTKEAPGGHGGRGARAPGWGGGFVGWIGAYAGLRVFVQLLGQMMTSPTQQGGKIDPELGAVLFFGALVCGGGGGAVLGLVIWAAWFLAGRWAEARRRRGT